MYINTDNLDTDKFGSYKLYRKFPLEILLLIVAISANLLKDLLNPQLVKFINKNRVVKYFILLFIAGTQH